MDELLKELNIPQSNDISSIEMELELRQRSLLEKCQSTSADQQELSKELPLIEKALSQIKWIKKAMSFGLSNERQEVKREEQNPVTEDESDPTDEEYNNTEFDEIDSNEAKRASEGKAILANYESTLAKAKEGDINAQYELAWMYFKGENAWKDSKRAEYWFEKAAEQGHIQSQIDLGELIYTNRILKNDPLEGLYWVEKVALQGNTRAIEILFEDCLNYRDVNTIEALCKQYETVFRDNLLYTGAQLRLAIHYDKFKKEDFSKQSKFYEWSHKIITSTNVREHFGEKISKMFLDAAKSTDKAVRYEQESYKADAFYYFGLYFEKDGDPKRSKDNYEKAKRYGSKQGAIRWAELTFEEALPLTEEARSEYIKIYQSALDLEMKSPFVYRRLYELYTMDKSGQEQKKLAEEYLSKACQMEDAQAYYYKGADLLKLAKGKKYEWSYLQEALDYLEKAANKGNMPARYEILLIHMNESIKYPDSFPISKDKIVDYVQSLFHMNHEDTCKLFAKLYITNQTEKIKKYQLTDKKIMEFIPQLVANGDAEMEYYMGTCTFMGNIVNKNIEEGIRLIQSAASKNNPEAIKWLTIYYYDEKIYDKAAYWGLMIHDKTDDIEVKWRMGLLFYHGRGTAVDRKKAFSILDAVYTKLDNNSKYSDVFTYLGVIYRFGLGIDHNVAKWLFNSAEAMGMSGNKKYLDVGKGLIIGRGSNYDIANQLFEKAVSLNNPHAMLQLGMMYEFGYGRYQNIHKAIELYEKAKKGNEAEACYRLAKIYLAEDKKDKQKALANLTEGVRLEEPNSMLLLADLYASDNDMKDQQKACDLYEKLANKGNTEALFKLANLLLNDGEAKILEGIRWLMKASEQGHPEAQFQLANYYLEGAYVEKNFTKGLNSLIKAASNDHKEAFHKLFDYYQKDKKEGILQVKRIIFESKNDEIYYLLASAFILGKLVEQDHGEFLYWSDLGVKNHHAKSLYLRGCYMEHYTYWSHQRDVVKAFSSYYDAALRGDPIACYNLGLCYQEEKGILKDELRAIIYKILAVDIAKGWTDIRSGKKWEDVCYELATEYYRTDNELAIRFYTMAGEQGHIKSQIMLAEFYKDTELAAEWWRKAAENGNSSSMVEIGNRLYNGIGIEKDINAAIQWYEKAYHARERRMAYRLGCIYHKECSPVDMEKAIYWYTEAHKQRYREASYELGEIYYHGRYNVAIDYEKALSYYEYADHRGAFVKVADMYHKGIGVAKDHNKAIEWYKKAISSKETKSKYDQIYIHSQLIHLYVNGEGLEPRYEEAYKMYTSFEWKNDIKDENTLLAVAHLCEEGLGCTKDLHLAKMLYQKAAQNGSKEAEKKLKSWRFKFVK